MNTDIFTRTWVAAGLLAMLAAPAIADEKPSGGGEDAPAVPVKSSGILPLPDYSGDLSDRAYLMGDLGGKRSEWASKGVKFDLDYSQYFQNVVDGGVDTDSEYGGVVDFNLAVDFDRMGVIPGGLLQMRAVSRYGQSVNGISGSAIPVNANATTPTTSNPDDDVLFYVPSINYTQFLSPKFALLLGKLTTYDQANEFTGGSGKSQFWNLNLVAPKSPALTVPYSVLGGGVIVIPTPNLVMTALVATSRDTSNVSGFDYLDDGKFGMLKVSYQYQLDERPGGFTNQFGYGRDNDFTELNGRLNFGPGGLEPTTKDNTWFNALDFWQYLWVEDNATRQVDSSNGRQDLQGVGVFSRIQFADDDTNPLDYAISVGLSAKGLFPARSNDTMGIGYDYNKLQTTRLGNIVGIDDWSSVWEVYYNFELTPAIHLSLDAQVAKGALPDSDTATILGTSLQVRF